MCGFQVNDTKFLHNGATNGGAVAMQSVTNATFSGITAVGNTAGCGGGVFIDRAARIQVSLLPHASASCSCVALAARWQIVCWLVCHMQKFVSGQSPSNIGIS